MFALIYAILGFSGSNKDHITYDEFVKEFLLKGNVKEIVLTEKGRIFVEIRDSKNEVCY